jgi:hypothetical protein
MKRKPHYMLLFLAFYTSEFVEFMKEKEKQIIIEEQEKEFLKSQINNSLNK